MPAERYKRVIENLKQAFSANDWLSYHEQSTYVDLLFLLSGAQWHFSKINGPNDQRKKLYGSLLSIFHNPYLSVITNLKIKAQQDRNMYLYLWFLVDLKTLSYSDSVERVFQCSPS